MLSGNDGVWPMDNPIVLMDSLHEMLLSAFQSKGLTADGLTERHSRN